MDNKNETPVSAVPTDSKSGGFNAKKTAASIFDIFEMFALCTAVILLLFSYVARLTVVEGPSMEDTLYENDYLIVYDIGYTPERGDIVVIHNIAAPLRRDNAEPIIKRVIAVEGDTVKIDNDTDTVYVNGEAIDEPYANFED
ncbi:MAG: signal peptidase I, partial [Clostridia bacterium]|nr:signal peptidase I [Clostridia bacterium]